MHLRVLLDSKEGTIGNTFVLILTTREEVTYRKQSKDVRVRVSLQRSLNICFILMCPLHVSN